jgi:hypothetical protein
VKTVLVALSSFVCVLTPVPALCQSAPVASDAAIANAAAAIVRGAGSCAAVWPGFWYPGKPFGLSRQADRTLFVYLPDVRPPEEYERVAGGPDSFFRRRGYPEGFRGLSLNLRLAGRAMPVMHAYTPDPQAILALLYHESFHGYQWERFTLIPASPAFGGSPGPAIATDVADEFSRLATEEVRALVGALEGGPGVTEHVHAFLRARARRAAIAPDAAATERYEEQTEGTAQYVGEMCTALATGAGVSHARASIRGELLKAHPALAGGRPSKWRAYGVGAALALVLEDLRVAGWTEAVARGEALDLILARAVGDGPVLP